MDYEESETGGRGLVMRVLSKEGVAVIPNPTQTIQHWENFFQMCGLAAMQRVLLGLWREIFIDNS